MVTFTLTDKKISMQMYFDLLKYLSKNLGVGVEMERPVPQSESAVGQGLEAIGHRQNRDSEDGLEEYRDASGTKHNVVYCYHDGTVRCRNNQYGVEVVFCGTSENMRWIYDRLYAIEKKLDSLRADDYHESCSNHITLVTMQHRPIPDVVFRNLFNLTRAYSSALYWLGSGDRTHLVRSQCESNANPRLGFAPYTEGSLFPSCKTTDKYYLLNVYKQKYNNDVNNSPNGVMLEYRNIDGMRVPSAVAALMVMHRALFMKAVDLSLSGVLKIEGDKFTENIALTRKIIRHGARDSKLTTAEVETVTAQAKELIALLTPHLKSHSPEAIPVLYKLCDRPVSFTTGRWEAVDRSLFKPNHELTTNEVALVDIVVHHRVVKGTAGEWKKAVARNLSLSERMIEHMMNRITEKTLRGFVYEKALGSFVMRG